MKNPSGIPDLSDTDLEDHINHLQSKLDRITISLQLATAERDRRSQQDIKRHTTQSKSEFSENRSRLLTSPPSPPSLKIGSYVRILNKYKGNKGKIGRIIDLSQKTATVYIPGRGNFIKQLHNLELTVSDET